MHFVLSVGRGIDRLQQLFACQLVVPPILRQVELPGTVQHVQGTFVVLKEAARAPARTRGAKGNSEVERRSKSQFECSVCPIHGFKPPEG